MSEILWPFSVEREGKDYVLKAQELKVSTAIMQAISFAKMYDYYQGIKLYLKTGVEIMVFPDSKFQDLKEKFNQELFKNCGIEK